MDNLKRLELEYEGIRETILDYTSEGNIVNFLDGLKNHYNQHTTLFNRLENSRGEIHIMCFYKSAAGTATML